ncbi:L,D-transpeptidase catalytic domain [Prevotellaceae bacterium HUN156]|nr:L,D-transpeptidase catalytic domain [Prevotellaceae bacterium HUN156]
MEAFSDMKAPAFVFDHQRITQLVAEMARHTSATTEADRRTREYYSQAEAPLLWIDRAGVDYRADSLLARLHLVSEIGMSERAFCVADIERDLQQLRQLNIGEGSDDINHLAARLEFQLTKACMRYTYGHRFGFINPSRIFNHLDQDEKSDSVRRIVRYRGLFDVDMDFAPADYYQTVAQKIAHDSIVEYLSEIQPQNKFYNQLKAMLKNTTTDEQRQRILCNMERCRWRLHHPIPETGKRIIVNVPAYHLYALGGDTTLHMRVVCGAQRTKTPLLTSEVEWMEVNPQWVIPHSILEKDVARHAGDSAYFARNKYRIFERATNKQMEIGEVSRAMLLSGKYRVAQESGDDNSLGRLVFRFKNSFSVFLHYTSTPWVFQRDSRAISHGCVRVEKPYELAVFVLDQPDEWLLDRIRISMGLSAMTDRGRQYLRTHRTDEDHKLIGYVPVKPHVPLYIIYYTLWPDEQGILQTWPDVYGYDRVILQHLQPYLS